MANTKNKQSKKKEVFFDKEEKELSNYIENTDLKSLSKKEREKMMDRLSLSAKNTLSKSKTVSLRLSERDLLKIKERAIAEGIPYQTLMASILHKHLSGKCG